MAIKGKKKSGNRGSQARRRPAAAPRPVAAASRHKDPWYNTAAGRVIAATLVVLLIAGIGALIAKNRSDASEKQKRLEAIEDYTNEVTALVQSAAPSVGAMSAVVPGAEAEQLETLKEDAEGWTTEIEAAAGRASGIQAPEAIRPIHAFFGESFQLYLTTARLKGNAADAEGKAQQDLLTRAAEVQARADAVWGNAVLQLDEELGELGGDPSGLQSPGMAGAQAAIPTTPEEPSGGEEGDGEGSGGDGGGEDSGSDDGSGGGGEGNGGGDGEGN